MGSLFGGRKPKGPSPQEIQAQQQQAQAQLEMQQRQAALEQQNLQLQEERKKMLEAQNSRRAFGGFFSAEQKSAKSTLLGS